MAVLQWPDGLRGPLISNYSRSESMGFIESDLTAGPSFVVPITDDTPVFHSVSFQFTASDARMFQIWLRVNRFKTLSPWFDAPMVNEDQSIETQECRFTADGYPQLSSKTIGGICTYSATLLARSLPDDNEEYDDIFTTMWVLAGSYGVDKGVSLLDEGICYGS